jgi:hypothetical protein
MNDDFTRTSLRWSLHLVYVCPVESNQQAWIATLFCLSSHMPSIVDFASPTTSVLVSASSQSVL